MISQSRTRTAALAQAAFEEVLCCLQKSGSSHGLTALWGVLSCISIIHHHSIIPCHGATRPKEGVSSKLLCWVGSTVLLVVWGNLLWCQYLLPHQLVTSQQNRDTQTSWQNSPGGHGCSWLQKACSASHSSCLGHGMWGILRVGDLHWDKAWDTLCGEGKDTNGSGVVEQRQEGPVWKRHKMAAGW